MRTQISLIFAIAIIAATTLWFNSPPAYAAVDYVTIAKTVFSKTDDAAARGRVINSHVATVARRERPGKAGDAVQVSIVVTNSSNSLQSFVIRDTYKDPSIASGFDTPDLAGAGWYPKGGIAKVHDYVAASPCGTNQVCASVDVPAGAAEWEFRYDLKDPILPTHKDRLLAFPVQSNANDATSFPVVDVGYVLFTPDLNAPSSVVASSFASEDGKYDLGIISPGVEVTVVGEAKTKSADAFLLLPRRGEDTSSTQRSCKTTTGATPSFDNRSGACVYSSAATVSIAGEGNNASALAHMMVLPSSAIIGSVFVGSAAEAKNILLPGQHVAVGNLGSSTARANINVSIDPDSVSGWKSDKPLDPGYVYKNVYQNANIARLKRNPDRILSSKQFTGAIGPTISTFGVSCSIIGSPSSCGSPASGTRVFTLTANTATNFDLSDPNYGSAIRSTPSNKRKDGFVLYVGGNLVIKSGTAVEQTITNIAGGTIVVEGTLTLQDTTFTRGSEGKPLGFIVLGGDNTPVSGDRAMLWTVGGNNNSSFSSVAFFVPNGTFKAKKLGSGSLNLLGSIVADNVDLSETAAPSADVDQSSITIQADPRLVTDPPPGMSVFSSSKVIEDVAP